MSVFRTGVSQTISENHPRVTSVSLLALAACVRVARWLSSSGISSEYISTIMAYLHTSYTYCNIFLNVFFFFLMVFEFAKQPEGMGFLLRPLLEIDADWCCCLRDPECSPWKNDMSWLVKWSDMSKWPPKSIIFGSIRRFWWFWFYHGLSMLVQSIHLAFLFWMMVLGSSWVASPAQAMSTWAFWKWLHIQPPSWVRAHGTTHINWFSWLT